MKLLRYCLAGWIMLPILVVACILAAPLLTLAMFFDIDDGHLDGLERRLKRLAKTLAGGGR